MSEILVRCSRCEQTHAVEPGETPCAPGAWIEDASGFSWESAERLRAAGFVDRGRPLYDIAAERQRQIEEEGYNFEHDDAHVGGEIAQAAACFALPYLDADGERLPRLSLWPWRWPHTPTLLRKHDPARRRDELVRAGALIVAEIERLDRLAA